MNEPEIEESDDSSLDLYPVLIESSKCKALRLVCAELGLTQEATQRIESQASLLWDFESHGKVRLKSPRDRGKSLNKVEKLATELRAAIQDLDHADLFDLWRRMSPESLASGHKKILSTKGATAVMILRHVDSLPIYDIQSGRVGHVSTEAEKLAHAAHEAFQEIGDKGSSGGRISTQKHYAWHVGQIFDAVKNTHIKLGRGGDFERLCGAIWGAAGVPSLPSGAIRQYIENLRLSAEIPDDSPF